MDVDFIVIDRRAIGECERSADRSAKGLKIRKALCSLQGSFDWRRRERELVNVVVRRTVPVFRESELGGQESEQRISGTANDCRLM